MALLSYPKPMIQPSQKVRGFYHRLEAIVNRNTGNMAQRRPFFYQYRGQAETTFECPNIL